MKGNRASDRPKVQEEKIATCTEASLPTVTLPSGEQIPLVVGVGSAGKGLVTSDGLIGNQRVKVLRDTGCTGVVVKESFVRQEQMTGGMKRCLLIDRTARIFPVATIYVNTP